MSSGGDNGALQQISQGAITMIVLSTIFVGLKLCANHFSDDKRRKMHWNDVLSVVALVVFVLLCSFAIAYANAYMAAMDAQSDSEQENAVIAIYKWDYVIAVLYPIASALPKVSLCVLYLRLFNVAVWTRRITYVTIAFIGVNAIAWLVPSIIVCQPISAFWNLQAPPEQCINYPVFGTWISFPNIISDLVILILPMPVLWKMHLQFAKKLGLAITFAAGSAGIAGACVRFGVFVHRQYVEEPGSDQTTRSIALDMIVTCLECGMYLITSCLPSLRIVLVKMHETLTNSFASIKRRYRQYSARVSGTSRTDRDSKRQAAAQAKINVKLTGVGKLETLLREGEDIGLSRRDSGLPTPPRVGMV